jgi:hypothetical protein
MLIPAQRLPFMDFCGFSCLKNRPVSILFAGRMPALPGNRTFCAGIKVDDSLVYKTNEARSYNIRRFAYFQRNRPPAIMKNCRLSCAIP